MTDGGPPPADGGPIVVNCPTTAPMREEMMGACCFRTSNADRLDMPELRLAGVRITAPGSLSSPIVAGLLSAAFDAELFNWLLRFEVTGTDVTVTTGYGQRNADGTFSFTMGAAPAPGPTDRWDPVTAMGTIAGETITVPALNGTITTPVFQEDGTTLQLELPIRNLELEMATLTAERSCIGRRAASGYVTSDGALSGYITVEDADAGMLMVGETVNTTLCMFTAGLTGDEFMGMTCADVSRDMWPMANRPDSLCDGTGCTQGSCDPATDCNAWRIEAGFAAQGVTVSGG
jgi:hypothetical protein